MAVSVSVCPLMAATGARPASSPEQQSPDTPWIESHRRSTYSPRAVARLAEAAEAATATRAPPPTAPSPAREPLDSRHRGIQSPETSPSKPTASTDISAVSNITGRTTTSDVSALTSSSNGGPAAATSLRATRRALAKRLLEEKGHHKVAAAESLPEGQRAAGPLMSSDDRPNPPVPSKTASELHSRLMTWERTREQTLQRARDEASAAADRECTFQPSVPAARRSSPAELRDLPVEDRLAALAKRSAEELHRQRLEAAVKREEDCTFKPSISSPRDDAGPEARSTPRRPPWEPQDYLPVEARTTRSRLCHMLGTDWHLELDPECRFQPIIGEASQDVYVVSRLAEGSLPVHERLYNRSLAGSRKSAATRTRSVEGGASGLPFTSISTLPQAASDELDVLRGRFGVQGTSSSHEMASFLDNVLSRGVLADGEQGSRMVLHDEESIGRPATAGADASVVAVTAAGDVDPPNSAIRFTEFLERQNALERSRRRHIGDLEKEHYPPAVPRICAKSRTLSKGRRSSPSLLAHPRKVPTGHDDHCTFWPVINPITHKIRSARGCHDMHHDASRREKAVNELRAQRDQRELAHCTFEPTLSFARGGGDENSPGAAGPLKGGNASLASTLVSPGAKDAASSRKTMTRGAAATDPYQGIQSCLSKGNINRYLTQLRAKETQRESELQRHRLEMESTELEECTFRPQTHALPEYLRRMGFEGI